MFAPNVPHWLINPGESIHEVILFLKVTYMYYMYVNFYYQLNTYPVKSTVYSLFVKPVFTFSIF
jgi:hypothetical protein